MKQGLSCIPWFEVQDSNLSNAPLLDFLVTCNKTTVCAVEEGRMKCSNNGCANERKRSGGGGIFGKILRKRYYCLLARHLEEGGSTISQSGRSSQNQSEDLPL